MALSTEMVALLMRRIRRIQEEIRDAVVLATEQQASDALAAVAHDDEGDTLYAIDRISEAVLVARIEQEIAAEIPLVLVAEGLDPAGVVLPRGTARAQARLRVIVDPIDGTRGLMYQKRPGWILTGVAPELGETTSLRDIEVAVMTEIPLVKQHLSDVLWASVGKGAAGRRFDRVRGTSTSLRLMPSRARTLEHGFAQVCRFFPGTREELAAIDDEICRAVSGPPRPGKALCFEDQYICSGGQLAELIFGHDRFTADLRPLISPTRNGDDGVANLCCHPYDLCTELIAREAGVIVCAPDGNPLNAPLDLTTNVAWAGYANAHLHALVEPALKAALSARARR